MNGSSACTHAADHKGKEQQWVSSSGENTNIPLPHKIPEAKVPANARRVHHGLCMLSGIQTTMRVPQS